jgi:hypothetical protein
MARLGFKFIRSALVKLTTRQKSFRRKAQLDGEHCVNEWLEFFVPLEYLDNKLDPKLEGRSRQLRLLEKSRWILFLLSFLSVFLGAFSGSFAIFKLMASLFALAMVGTPLFRMLCVRPLRLLDIDNRMKEFVMPFLSVVGQDCGERNQIELALDLRHVEQKAFHLGRENLHKAATSIAGTVDSYLSTWFRGSYKMLDDTEVDFSMDLELFRRQKRSRSGKRVKVKRKYRNTVFLTVKAQSSLYQVALNQPKNTEFILGEHCRGKMTFRERKGLLEYRIKLVSPGILPQQAIPTALVIEGLGKVFSTLKPIAAQKESA